MAHKLRSPRFYAHIFGLVLVVELITPHAALAAFLSPKAALELMRTSDATVIDARGAKAEAPYLPGSTSFNWHKHRDGWFRVGRLDSDLLSVAEAFEAAGVSNDRPVVIYGNMAKGWGEEGRVWWTLRYLGHKHVYIVDGGIAAWIADALPTVPRRTKRPKGTFHIKAQAALRMRGEALASEVGKRASSALAIIDTRDTSEYNGATPYYSARGGHIASARHLDWKDFIGSNGRLKSIDTIRHLMQALGLGLNHRIVTYCTGGVRAAFMHAALEHAGFSRVSTYDGSFWEWAAHSDWPIE